MISALSIQGWAHAARSALAVARPEIDALNVFPVPDGDTGTNVYLTMEAACVAADEAAAGGSGRSEVAQALARGAMLGARGNSGVILSEYLRGIGAVLGRLADARELDGRDLAGMLTEGAELAYRAVSRPVEGTILSVARAAAAAAGDAGADTLQVARRAAEAAQVALERTPLQLPALAAAGVVDAGGRALVVILDALVGCLRGEEVAAEREPGSRDESPPRALPEGAGADGAGLPGYQGPAYEVMFLLESDADRAMGLRAVLEGLGDSVLVVGEGHTWNVHVHVDDAGAAIEAGMAHGRPYRIQVSYLASLPRTKVTDQRVLVAVAHGRGIADLLREQGVRILWAEPQQRPSAAEFLAVIAGSDAPEIVLLPSDQDTQPVAELAARQARAEGRRVAVIPTRAVVQTLAAVAVHDPSQPFDDDVVAMTRAAGATRYAAVTIASRQALTTAGPCEVGDVLGIVDGDIGMVGPTVEAVARGVLDAMLAVGGELVTLAIGEQAEPAAVDALTRWLATAHPTVEVVVVSAGQPRWPLIIGVE